MSKQIQARKRNHKEPEEPEDAQAIYNDALLQYNRWWPYPDGTVGPEADEARRKRQENANQLVIDYYNLVSPSYERGWGHQFHYCPMSPGKSITQNLLEYEVLIGEFTGLKAGMKVLDVGCGVSGPARTMAKKFQVDIVGVTNSPWHVQRGRELNREAGLDGRIRVVQGDFRHLPFEDNTFDAAYALEAICHVPDPMVAWKELRRVLKPGAVFVEAEWVMTDKYDRENETHRIVNDQIERGNALSKIPLISDVRNGLKECGFVTTYEELLESRSKPGPWYYPLLGMLRYATCREDFLKTVLMERKVVVPLVDCLYWVLAKLGAVPKELPAGFQVMKTCSKSVAVGSQMGIFSPMALFVSKNGKEV